MEACHREGRDEDGAPLQLVSVPATWQDYTLSEIGLQLKDPDIDYERFEVICSMLGALHTGIRFAIGDAIVQGEHLFGERSYQAFEQFQLSEEAMKEYVRVAQRVPRSRRRKGLSWSHHRAVAALEPPAQKEWLAKAVNEGLSHHSLRDALRDPSRNGVQPECCPTCGKRL